LAPKPTGRALGEQRRLSSQQELHSQRLICEKRSEQLKLTFALWTRAAVVLLVRQEFDIELPIRTMGWYLKRWGFTPKKPSWWLSAQAVNDLHRHQSGKDPLDNCGRCLQQRQAY
jgi:transposase